MTAHPRKPKLVRQFVFPKFLASCEQGALPSDPTPYIYTPFVTIAVDDRTFVITLFLVLIDSGSKSAIDRF